MAGFRNQVQRLFAMLLFLDFDGVLRSISAPPMVFEDACLAEFEAVVREFAALRIVISSSWRLDMSLLYIRTLFSGDIASRIIGQTPVVASRMGYARYGEIMSFLKRFAEHPRSSAEPLALNQLPWVAVDDDPDHFPKDAVGSNVLLTDPATGFRARAASRLRQMLIPMEQRSIV